MSKIEQKEEKAKEYVADIIGDYHYVGWNKFEAITELTDAYTAGYTAAEQDLSTENEQLRKVLKEAIPYVEDAIKWYKSKGSVHQEFIREDIEFLTKAKHLIE